MKTAISYDVFDQLELRVGTVVDAAIPEWSKKLLRFKVDFGEEVGTRIIFSGVKEWYTPEDFLNKQFVFLVNLTPKKMADEESQGMMLMADADQPVIIPVANTVANGTLVR